MTTPDPNDKNAVFLHSTIEALRAGTDVTHEQLVYALGIAGKAAAEATDPQDADLNMRLALFSLIGDFGGLLNEIGRQLLDGHPVISGMTHEIARQLASASQPATASAPPAADPLGGLLAGGMPPMPGAPAPAAAQPTAAPAARPGAAPKSGRPGRTPKR